MDATAKREIINTGMSKKEKRKRNFSRHKAVLLFIIPLFIN